MPRVLGLCDRHVGSPTLGCADRYYWHYKLLDIPNARFQEAGLLFGLAWKADLPGNSFFGKQVVLDWARACWNYWLDSRNCGGSVNEVYPFERSFCATSFTAACFAETVALTGGGNVWGEEIRKAAETFSWLSENSNPEVGNQMAASLWALSAYSTITGDAKLLDAAHKRLAEVADLVTLDGVLPEYGGLDVGYQTVSLSALCHAANHLEDSAELADIIARLEARLRQNVGPAGEVDAERNSRKTGYMYPFGLFATGSALLASLGEGIVGDTVITPSWMDDRYCIPLAIDYLRTAMEFSDVDVYK